MSAEARVSVELAHEIAGPAGCPLVVLLHSIGTDRDVWAEHVAALTTAGRRVLRVDLRGHGRSPVPPGPYAVADLAADVVCLLDRLDEPHADVCGVSLGGAVALELALAAPHRIRRIVVCCSAPWFGGREVWGPRIATARAEGAAPLADGTVGRWFTPSFCREHPDRVDLVRETLVRTAPEGYAAAAEALAAFDVRDALSGIAIPTLVVGGAHDVATPVDLSSRPMAAAIPGARLEIVPAAHLAPYERPDLVAPLLLEHLDG